MYDQRVKKLRDALLEKGIDSLLISNFYNILYLTGFKTLTKDEREAFVLVTKNKIYLFSDERYVTKNFQFPPDSIGIQFRLIEPQKGLISHLRDILKDEQIKILGFEAEDLRFYEYQKLRETLKNVEPFPTSKLIVKIREIKDAEEIVCIQKACEIGDQCLTEITKTIKLETTEKEVAFKIEMWLREKGYNLAFDPIVAIDSNSAVAHYNTKDGQGSVKVGSVILVDFGVKYKDYLSDITRMIFFGQPADEVRRTYDILLEGQEKTIEKLANFDSLKDADNFCRKLITENRLPNYPHSTGHGVGLEIHEYPKVSFNSPDRKILNQVFTIEPGVYFPGKMGMRIEDTVVIGKDLKAEILTKFPKVPLII
ncbi:aminopeptidase P family protein [Candidatus Roizmanbacteria bacterium]|nr:aminopeptidase P family protein [Candidatus Roizmanbacteria bacterium]